MGKMVKTPEIPSCEEEVKEMEICLAWQRDSSGDERMVFSYLKGCSVEEIGCVLCSPEGGGREKGTGRQILIVRG